MPRWIDSGSSRFLRQQAQRERGPIASPSSIALTTALIWLSRRRARVSTPRCVAALRSSSFFRTSCSDETGLPKTRSMWPARKEKPFLAVPPRHPARPHSLRPATTTGVLGSGDLFIAEPALSNRHRAVVEDNWQGAVDSSLQFRVGDVVTKTHSPAKVIEVIFLARGCTDPPNRTRGPGDFHACAIRSPSCFLLSRRRSATTESRAPDQVQAAASP